MELPDVTDYTDEDLSELMAAVSKEADRRRTVETAGDRIDSILHEVKDAQGVEQGDAWEQPAEATTAYPAGWQVTHDGRLWVSLLSANVWEPGVANWRQVMADPDDVPPWEMPTGAGSTYKVGDRVEHNGEVWESFHANNVWEPGAQGTETLWKKV